MSTGKIRLKKTFDSPARVVTMQGAKGVHRLFDGQTQSGKSTANRILLRMAKSSLVFGTKPGQDSALDDYVTKEGYLRIKQWPPTSRQLAQRGPFDQVKLLLWPEIKKYGDLRGMAPMFRKALQDLSVEMGWTVSVDEGLWFCSSKGLGLGDEVADLAYGGASNGTSLHILVQRPRQIPPIIPASCHEGYFFVSGGTSDLQQLASFTSHPTRDFAAVIRGLNKGNEERGHEFLYAPLSGGTAWAVTEVPADWT